MKPIFLSYSRKNVKDVQKIADTLCAGGIRIWQDLESLATGNTDEQIRKAIQEECAAFFLCITDESVKSEFIREVEIKEALNKSKRDETFHIVPLIHMPLEKANQKLQGSMLGDISRYNGVIIHDGETLSEVSSKIRKILLKAIIKRPADQDFAISLMTYSRTPGNIQPQLDLDWSRLDFSDKIMSDTIWKTHLLPALKDVKDALLNAGVTHIRLYAKATLSASMAFGYIFRRETGFKIIISQEEQLWSSQDKPEKPSGLKIKVQSRNIGSKHLGINLSITSSIDNSLGNYIDKQHLSLCAELFCEPAEGPSRESVPNHNVASAMAWEIGNAVRDAKSKYNIADIHIFGAMPLGLAVLIGSELNACGIIHLYEFNKSESMYYPSWTLEGNY
jgi:hypothetical protein